MGIDAVALTLNITGEYAYAMTQNVTGEYAYAMTENVTWDTCMRFDTECNMRHMHAL